MASHQQPMFLIMAVFARAPRPRAEELPEIPTVTDLQPDQIMCRRRMNIITEKPMLVPNHGLVDNTFYHADLRLHTEYDFPELDDVVGDDNHIPSLLEHNRVYEERAVLFQSMEHYQELSEHSTMCKYVGHPHNALIHPRFGENYVVQGVNADTICVGDIFEVHTDDAQGTGPVALKIEITGPRLPCAQIDKKNHSPFGRAGLKRHCMTMGLAGWFARVLVPGELFDGMTMVRTSNPNPKWTLRYISRVMYGECDVKHTQQCLPQWRRTRQELEELVALPQLGWYEWKCRAMKLLKDLDKVNPDASRTNGGNSGVWMYLASYNQRHILMTAPLAILVAIITLTTVASN